MTPPMDMWEDYDHLAFEERCYEYDKAECYQNNNIEEQVDSESNQNPQRRKRKRKVVRSLLTEVKCSKTILMED